MPFKLASLIAEVLAPTLAFKLLSALILRAFFSFSAAAFVRSLAARTNRSASYRINDDGSGIHCFRRDTAVVGCAILVRRNNRKDG